MDRQGRWYMQNRHVVVNKMLIHFNFSRKFELAKVRAQGYR